MGFGIQTDLEVNNPQDFEILRASETIDDGTIMLWQPAKSGFSAYISGNVFKDVAEEDSSLLLGVDKSLLSTTLSVSNFPTELKVEKTAKGGLHFIVTQNTMAGSNRRAYLPITQPVKNYMEANIATHKFYVSFIGRFTRKATSAQRTFFQFAPGSFTGNYYFYMRSDPAVSASNQSGPSANSTYAPSREPAVGEPFMFTVEVIAKIGTWDYNGATVLAGFIGGSLGSATANGYPSVIMYEAQISDQTVSGKTNAQKRAEDLVRFNAMFAEGGDYFEDTWTTPDI